MFHKLFYLSIFLDLSQIQILLPFLAKIQMQKIVIVLVMLGVIFDSRLLNNMKSNFTGDHKKYLLILIAFIIMSAPFGVYPGNSLSFIIELYWKILVGYFLILAYISTEEDINKLIWIYVLAIGFLSLLIIKGSDSGRLAISEDVFDANDTAFLLLLGLPFLVWKFISLKGVKKYFVAMLLIAAMVALVKTNSRGAFLGLIAVYLVTITQINRLQVGGLGKIIIASVIVIGVTVYYGGDVYFERISTLLEPSKDYNVSDTHGRIQIWERGLDMMLSNPFFGVGVDNFISADGMLYADIGARYQAAHNSFIQIGAEIGIIGLLMFILLIWRSVKPINVMLKTENYKSINNSFLINGSAIVGSWTGYVVSGSFLSAAYISSFYFLLALSTVFIKIASSKDEISGDV